MSTQRETRRRATNNEHDNEELSWDQGNVRANTAISGYPFGSCCDHVCDQQVSTTDCHQHVPCCPYRPKHTNKGPSTHTTNDIWEEVSCSKTTISAENEVEAQKLANNYRFGFRKWKSHVTERPFEDRSEIVKELYSELNIIKPNTGNLCFRLSCYFLWPFGKAIKKTSGRLSNVSVKPPDDLLEEGDDGKSTSPLLRPNIAVENVEESSRPPQQHYWNHPSVYVWVLLGYPPLVVAHGVMCILSWLLVFTIPVAKMSIRTLSSVLLMTPEDVQINNKTRNCEGPALLCCYHAINIYYYKYTVDGINVFAVNLLPLVVVSLVIGYVDQDNQLVSAEIKFTTAIGSLIPLSYYIGMGIASISAQSNFAVGAVVNATFGSITELTFYITALLRGHHKGNICLQEIVKAALTGTLLGCILFIPGICMIIGGLKHREQRFNSRSAGVSSSLLFISIGGVFAPTLFSKAYGNLVCEDCTNFTGTNSSNGTFTCRNCHYDLTENNYSLFHSHIAPLVYTVSVLLPVSYIIGLLFTLKTHSHIYDIHIEDGSGVTILAMVPEIPEIVTGIQFALQNNISLSLEVGSCIAVQVCMIQIPILILFNAFYDVGFVLIFSDLHLWASIFSVILVNYIFMDGKSDYFQGTALVVVYLILLALYFFAPSPAGC
ncbi:Low affinity vacuolar monovalent cation/H(+) antiporter [Bagarius yarrelli]|uniref:Low affinity vacuolar monovalent cation/H(+) antiporter n=1 Tax=Bagarius yarrelli TaxID=175774 RepID=A0A556V0Z2_BAGYA|nr:Low affinity vacuolar monovalent cation/H(+) antiporter [Bagarius yarrelli]